MGLRFVLKQGRTEIKNYDIEGLRNDLLAHGFNR